MSTAAQPPLLKTWMRNTVTWKIYTAIVSMDATMDTQSNSLPHYASNYNWMGVQQEYFLSVIALSTINTGLVRAGRMPAMATNEFWHRHGWKKVTLNLGSNIAPVLVFLPGLEMDVLVCDNVVKSIRIMLSWNYCCRCTHHVFRR